MSDHEALLDLLVRYSVQHADQPTFHLASGQLSDTYINCKTTTMRHEAAQLIANEFAQYVPEKAVAVGGLTAGADPIAYAMRDLSRERVLDAFMVRKEAKAHGLRQVIEGPVKRGLSVVVVDDVVTSGASTITAIERCIDFGLDIAAVVVLVDREENDGMASIRDRVPGVPVNAIFTKSEILQTRKLPQQDVDTYTRRPTAARAQAS